jgi:hypothetical protein
MKSIPRAWCRVVTAEMDYGMIELAKRLSLMGAAGSPDLVVMAEALGKFPRYSLD